MSDLIARPPRRRYVYTKSQLRRELARRRARRAAETLKAAAADPRAFRAELVLNAGGPPLGESMLPWQRADFAALDPAWLRVAGRPLADGYISPETPLGRAWLERPRGHSKTADTAVMLAWALRFARRPIRGVVAAADQDQAGLVRSALAALVRANPQLLGELKVGAHRITHPATGARLDVISGDVGSSYGLTPDFVICDELCHWSDAGLWHSLLSSAAKTPGCLLIVLTNAGWGRDWRWTAREAARTRPDWLFRRLPGPCAPWVTPAALAEQRALLPEPVFARLWLNEWQANSAAAFFTPAEVAACEDATLEIPPVGRPGVRYAAGVDYGEKRDRTACCVAHRCPRSGRIVVDRLDVAAPAPDRPVPVAWVENWLTEVAAKYPGLRVVADEYQLAGLAQRLTGRVRIERFAFAAGRGNDELARALRTAVYGGRLAFRPGVGAVESHSGDTSETTDDLAAELRALELVERPGGRVRFDHPSGGHDDRAFALSLAVWALADDRPAGPEPLLVSSPAF
ncbi:terminase large subunit domain-containing protein [Alienimonas sp. DA493]|uniref:terminase large subunit domain-containing protein n=1 Tax=Alienimonas sp. DA493 TaxID=3373605 RepID=UPI003754DC0F